jgi:hypothetical protein
MPTQLQSAQRVLSLLIAAGARPGRSFPVQVPPGLAAGASFSASSQGITMGQSNPAGPDSLLQPLLVTPGMTVFDASTGQTVGTVDSWPAGSRTLILTAPALAASAGAADLLIFYSTPFARGFPGALQSAFLQSGYQIGDLAGGLAYAVAQGWLSQGQTIGGSQNYTLELAGWTTAGGTAPTMAAAAQQVINVCVHTLGGAANRDRFEAKSLASYFVGTVGGNTFAPEDLLPGVYYAVAQAWLRPAEADLFEPVFVLTAPGVAQAS